MDRYFVSNRTWNITTLGLLYRGRVGRPSPCAGINRCHVCSKAWKIFNRPLVEKKKKKNLSSEVSNNPIHAKKRGNARLGKLIFIWNLFWVYLFYVADHLKTLIPVGTALISCKYTMSSNNEKIQFLILHKLFLNYQKFLFSPLSFITIWEIRRNPGKIEI